MVFCSTIIHIVHYFPDEEVIRKDLPTNRHKDPDAMFRGQDRMKFSFKNHWVDDEGLVYVIYPLDEIQEDMGISRKQAEEYLKELEQAGLLERQPQGFGLPDKLYLKRILYEKC